MTETPDQPKPRPRGKRAKSRRAAREPGAAPELPPPPPADPVMTPVPPLVVGPSLWPAPDRPATLPALVATLLAGLAGAIALPLDRPGLGWFVTALVSAVGVAVVARGRASATLDTTARINQAVFAVLALALVGIGALRDAGWLFVVCVLAACAAGSLAVTSEKPGRALVAGALAVPFSALLTLPWLGRGLVGLRRKGGGSTGRLLISVLVSVGLLAIFIPLLAGADAVFAQLLTSSMPTVDGKSAVRTTLAFLLVGLGTAGACYRLAARRPEQEQPPALVQPPTTQLRRIEWALPVGVLTGLFAVFVAVQVAGLFGGEEWVLSDAGPTYAQYARGGFWQLLAVAVLTLGVIGAAARWAARETPSDRGWLRGLLGALAVLTLGIVASALVKMWTYQQAYGFTVLRLVVEAAELWLGVVYLLVIAAGLRMRIAWLPRAVVGSGLAVLLGLAVLNPERMVADRNVDRFEQTQRIDLYYLSRLSADAAPALARLPGPQRTCALAALQPGLDDRDDWRGWNAARSTARELTKGLSWTESCFGALRSGR